MYFICCSIIVFGVVITKTIIDDIKKNNKESNSLYKETLQKKLEDIKINKEKKSKNWKWY